MVKLVDGPGHSIMLMEETFQLLRSNFLIQGKDFPFLLIPEWYKYTSARWYTVDVIHFYILSILNSRYSSGAMGFFFQKYDSRIKFFDHVIDVLTEAGIIGHFFDTYIPQRGIKEHETVSDEKLTLEHFLIPNIFLMSMLLISLAAMIAELCYRPKNRNK